MSGLYLTTDFATQSYGLARTTATLGATVREVIAIDTGRGLAIRLEAQRPPLPHITVSIAGLLPHRFYRIEGIHSGFARTDDDGALAIALHFEGHATLALWPVV